MNITTTSSTNWLDFSGAPPMLIPQSLAGLWRGTTDRATGEYREANVEAPVTDYDRACAAAWPGRSILEFMGHSVLVLYTEFDLHTWDDHRELVACGGWLPSDHELQRATWTDRIHWPALHTDFLLMNSAADGKQGLRDDDYLAVRLTSGIYDVDYCGIETESVGCFHRFIRATHAAEQIVGPERGERVSQLD
jgi:hypothetical protein